MQCSNVIGTKGCKRGCWGRILEGMEDVLDASNNQVRGQGNGHAKFGWEPNNGVTYAFGTRVPEPNIVAPVGIEGGTDVPAVKFMG